MSQLMSMCTLMAAPWVVVRGVYCAARGGATMGAKAEALAKQFEAKVQEATKVMEKLSDAEWKKVTSAERWPVCVVAHHIAIAHEGIGNLVKSVASGQHKPSMAMDDIDKMNAQHAKDFATAGKAETLALPRKNAATAAWTGRTSTRSAATSRPTGAGSATSRCAARRRGARARPTSPSRGCPG